MNFDNNTLQILKNFSSINNSIVFNPGTEIATIAESRSILAKATIEQEIEHTFAIYDLSKFLSTISLFDNPTFEIHEKHMIISKEGRKIKYVFADPSFISQPPKKKLNFPNPDVSFEVSAVQLQEIEKAIRILSLPEISIAGDGERITVNAIDSKNSGSDVYSIDMGETDKNFNLIIRAENIKVIPQTYQVEVTSAGLSKWSAPNMEYYITVEANSTFGG